MTHPLYPQNSADLTYSTLSPEGKCFAYDSRASGFGKGEGAACLIIKRLPDALACGDSIRAIIRNTVCSHSGRTQGISMPSRDSQEKLLLRLHRDIGVEANETAFVEVRQSFRIFEVTQRLRADERRTELRYRAMALELQ